MSICTRYYIYPIDQNINKIFCYSKKAMLNLIVIIISTDATACACTVLWNKRLSSMERKQIQNMDSLTPTTLSSSWLFNADRVLESVPR